MDRTRLASTGLALGLVAAMALPAAAEETTVRLMTHDSFWLPEGTFEAFEAEHGVTVQLFPSGDAGAMVNQAILTAEDPLADVLFGVDNTFLSRALEAGIFVPQCRSMKKATRGVSSCSIGRGPTPTNRPVSAITRNWCPRHRSRRHRAIEFCLPTPMTARPPTR